jgi:hypothetical protein
MKIVPYFKQIIGLFIVAVLFGSFRTDNKNLTIKFHHVLGSQLLILNDSLTNTFNEKIVVTKFKYYISNMVLINEKKESMAISNSYFLIDAFDSASKNITIPFNFKKITGIEFLLGVDSIKNCSGIQTGVLDPMLGMFWTWNSGYIFAKLEGTSTASRVAGHYFTYHIGGYKTGENAARKIKLSVISNSEKNILDIQVDLNKWFASSNDIRISQTPICHSPGVLAIQFADNYANLFSIQQ